MTIDYKAQVHRSSWFTPAQCLNYYKVPYQFREIQIHWWNDPSTKPTHDGVVNYQANKTGGSCNYVVSGGRITAMVAEENCALTTQGGNPYGIKLECSPYGTAADYDTISTLVSEIWKRRGKLPLVPHKRYFNTACPGTLDLNRITREAEAKFSGESSMIDAKDIGNIRVIMSEVEGWNGHLVHSGHYDKQIVSWVGKTWEEMISHCWKVQSRHRIHIEEDLKKCKAANTELTKATVIKDTEIVRLNKEIEVLKAQTSEDTEGLNKLGEVLAWLLKRIGIRS